MRTHVFAPSDYKGVRIYVRRFLTGTGEHFEYIFTYQGNLYAYPFRFRKQWWKKLLGIAYNEKEVSRFANIVKEGAATTIDLLQTKK